MSSFKDKVIYQIYTKSFRDSNGDGLGDIRGVIEKLDYLQELGIDYLWMTPFFRSPLNDNGYDISDYLSIDPVFGSMEDVEELIAQAEQRGIRLMFDMVFNHTSTEYQWFRRALAGEKKYQDYYIFRDGTPDAPPTNWKSKFGGNAWAYVPELGKWYLHLFDKTQADLNWDNPEVREANGWNAVFWCNHDQPRAVSRFGDDKRYWKESAKMLATSIHLLRGTPYIFQGEELGITNVGFTSGTPWITPPDNFSVINTEAEAQDEDSILHYYKALIRLRKKEPIIADGKIEFLYDNCGDIFVFRRFLGKDELFVFNNLTEKEVVLTDTVWADTCKKVIGNYPDVAVREERLVLRPYESIAWKGSTNEENQFGKRSAGSPRNRSWLYADHWPQLGEGGSGAD